MFVPGLRRYQAGAVTLDWNAGRGRDLALMSDLVSRAANRVQLTTDNDHGYLGAVGAAFDRQFDYAMLVEQYGAAAEAGKLYRARIRLGAGRGRSEDGPTRTHFEFIG